MSYEDELREFREAISAPAVGAAHAGELSRLHDLIEKYPDEAAEILAKVRGSV